MKRKKTEKASLENKKSLFFEIGFVVALGLVLLAFEWTTEPEKVTGFEQEKESDVVQESVPITHQEQQKEPPPPPPKSTDVLNIVDNEVKIENELELAETEADQSTEINIDAFSQQEEKDGSSGESEIFVVVEDMPTFKGGGLSSFRNYVQSNLEYPTIAAENGIEGTVFVKFVVDKDGGISNVKIMRGVDPALNKEAKRVIRNAPKWEPGSQRGKPVRVQFTIPITFKLQ